MVDIEPCFGIEKKQETVPLFQLKTCDIYNVAVLFVNVFCNTSK